VDPMWAKKDDTLPLGEPAVGLCRNVMRDCDSFLYARISMKARRHRSLTEINVTASRTSACPSAESKLAMTTMLTGVLSASNDGRQG
jgi:hypothetical protein